MSNYNYQYDLQLNGVRKRTFRLYAHLIADAEDMNKAFAAINVVENIAKYLISLYNGKGDCSSCGCVQYTDTIYINVSASCAKQIEKDYPFISETMNSHILTYE